MSHSAYRLSEHVRPTRYAVFIDSHPDKSDFSGRVRMELELRRAVDHIEMHARDLTIGRASIDGVPARFDLVPEDQLVRFSIGRPIPAGSAVLEAEFQGRPSPSMHGLYLAADGASRAICTQCEATDARAIFPCFDEPIFKASLEWTIRAPRGLLALSNGALHEVQEDGDDQIWRFEPTRPVSSYLAALVIGDFEPGETRIENGTPLTVYAPRGKREQTGFANGYTAQLLPWYEEYFGIPYPYRKYDQVAVPGFDAGAMENVGLVLFRQNLLLMDPKTSSWRQEKLIAKVIAHEFAHMWFGNLVTMRWWDDLWLNEAFAEWMAHKACDAATPDYRVWDDFQDDKNRALADDALPTTHPIYTAVATPAQAIEMFDVITYQKGCAVMRMLERFLGDEAFKRGLRAYMKAFAESNAAGSDLWRALEEASGQPVKALMESWVTSAGFPLVRASLDGQTLHLEQRRFFSSAKHAEGANEQLWTIPMAVRFEDDEGVKLHRFLMSERRASEPLPAKGAVRWCYPNAEEIGFYRSAPDEALADGIGARGLSRLSAPERMGFIEDRWALVRNGTIEIDRFVDALEALVRAGAAAEHNVLSAVVDRMGTIDRLLEDAGDEAAQANARAWIERLLLSDLDALGSEPRPGESQNEVQRRGVLVHALGRVARTRAVVGIAERAAERERQDPASVDPNLAGAFLGIAAMNGDEARYETWIDTYRARKASGATPQATLRYLYTLSAFRPELLTARTLAAIGDATVPQEAAGPILGQLLAERHGQDQAWAYMKANWASLRARIGDMGLSRVVEAVGALRAEQRADIVSFFEANPPPGAERALARALERMDQAAELRARVSDRLVRRFR